MYDPEVHSKWIEAVEMHQRFDRSKINYNVCIKHFESTDLEVRGSKICLKKDAVPTIFDETPVPTISDETEGTIDSQVPDPDINHSPECSECSECIMLKRELLDLKAKMLKLKLNNDIEIQKLSKQLESVQNLREQQTASIDKLKKDLSNEKSSNLELDNSITILKEENNELKSKKFFNLIDFKNVSFCEFL